MTAVPGVVTPCIRALEVRSGMTQAAERLSQTNPVKPTPGQLFALFLGVALVGIGGGLPAHARRALLAKGWMTDAEFAEAFTLAQLAPGPNAVNLSAMVGARLSGKRGAVLAFCGIMLPGLISMLTISALTLGSTHGLPAWVQSALHGAACAAIGVLLTAALPVVKVGLGVKGGLVVALLTCLALGVLRLDLLPVLLVLVGAGLVIHRPREAAHE